MVETPRASQAEPVEMLYRMVEIASPTGEEEELASYLVDRMRALGFRSHRDDAGNAVGEIGDPAGPTIMLLGHMDTVPGPLPARIVDDVVYGRGAVDAKGPLAAMVWAAARAARAGVRVVVVGAVGEEGTSPGARHLLAGPAPDAVIIGEPSGAAGVVIGYKGILDAALDVSRPPVHTSSPAEKAVEVAVAFWRDVEAYLADLYPEGRLFDRAIPTLVELRGDISRAHLRFSCRVPLGFDSAGYHMWLADRAKDDRLTIVEDVPAVRSRRTDPAVRALMRSIGEHIGRPAVKVKLGTSDMNTVAPRWGVPIAAYGPGDAGLCHTDEERIDCAEYMRAIDVLADTIGVLGRALER